MNKLTISGLIFAVAAAITYFFNVVYAAPIFAGAWMLMVWGVFERFLSVKEEVELVSHIHEQQERQEQIQVEPLQPHQAITQATEHTIGLPNGASLTVRKIVRWH